MGKSKKIYCKNCVFMEKFTPIIILGRKWDRYSDRCKKDDGFIIDQNGDKIETRVDQLRGHLNSNLDCQFYKRKWWKFWVKK
jgi:hypothetical protein